MNKVVFGRDPVAAYPDGAVRFDPRRQRQRNPLGSNPVVFSDLLRAICADSNLIANTVVEARLRDPFAPQLFELLHLNVARTILRLLAALMVPRVKLCSQAAEQDIAFVRQRSS